MKKVFVVSKTHLDLGFTDYAKNVQKMYINTFIPNAIDLAKRVNTNDKKYFIWTTGSWILKEALKNGNSEQQKNLKSAIERGEIVPHGMPFTVHSELLDYDTFDYGLSIVDELDTIRKRKTISAKMTDVPGHTKGIIKPLALHGIKLIHIGVNGASAMPNVPQCFLWKDEEYEIIVIYSGDYGGEFKCDFLEEILYFDHGLDNRCSVSDKKIKQKFKTLQEKYADYEIVAGSIDDFADIIWKNKDKLPVFEGEIGDTWIHGSASDPYKSASLRELMRLKQSWLNSGLMQKGSKEYNDFSDSILCIAEHTCGMDNKKYFADYENYLKSDFQKARQKDSVSMRHIFRDFPQNFVTAYNRFTNSYERGSYKKIEKSWQEQRLYINTALSSLSNEKKEEAEKALSLLIPKEEKKPIFNVNEIRTINLDKWSLKINDYGGICSLSYNDDFVIRENNSPVFEYRSYSKTDYDYWVSHYTRNLKETFVWSIGDFSRPLLKYVNKKYDTGRFPYFLDKIFYDDKEKNKSQIIVNLKCDNKLCDELGAPRLVQIIYSLSVDGLKIDLSWYQKDANRLTEALFFHLFPSSDSFNMKKIDTYIKGNSVVENGGRNLHSVFTSRMKTKNNYYNFINLHSPLISIGKGKILEFDNQFEDILKDGITYVLYNNVWGTNFPLWYEENAKFSFIINRDE